MKKNGKVKFKTKEELLEQMNYFLQLQIDIANKKEKDYKAFEAECVKEGKKTKNPYLNELNNQIEAINRTCGALIRINQSSLENGENQDDETKKKENELVD